MRGKRLEKFIEENADQADWIFLSQHRNFKTLSMDFIWKFREQWDWKEVSCYQRNLSEEFLYTFADYLDLYYCSFNCVLPEKLLRQQSDKISSWNTITGWQKLSEEFMEEFFNKFTVESILKHQKVSEKILRKHAHTFSKEEWFLVSSKQKLSEKFVLDYEHKMDWFILFASQDFSPKFFKKHKERVHGVQTV